MTDHKFDTLTREIALDSLERLDAGETKARYKATLSTSTPVMRWGSTEILVHKKGAVNMERAARGLPLLLNHDRDIHLGKIEKIHLDDGRLRGEIEFDLEDPDGAKWAGKIDRGMFSGALSIGASVQKHERVETDDGKIEYHLTRWTPLEASVATVPADDGAGIGRQHEDFDMTKRTDDTPSSDTGLSVVSDARDNLKRAEGVKNERERIEGLQTYFATRQHQTEEVREIERAAIAKGLTVEQAAAQYADWLDSRSEAPESGHRPPVGDRPRGGERPFAKITRDEADKWQEDVTQSMLLRSGVISDQAKRRELAGQVNYASHSAADLVREYMARVGHDVTGLSTDEMIGEALVARNIGVGQTASDFSSLLANVAEKAAMTGYDETPESWRTWCRVGSVSDFKQGKRVALSAFSDLDEVPDGGNYNLGSFSDVGESIQAKEYAKNFVISRQALINDDVAAFTRIPQAMGRAAARKVGDVVYTTTLYGSAGVGPTMSQDSTALFASGHSNYVAGGSGAAPSVSTLDTAFTAMYTQTDPSGEATLGIVPRFLIVPAALRATALTLRNSLTDPAEGSNTSFSAANPFYNALEVVVEPRIDGLNSAYWYLACDPSQCDTIEVAFLQGMESPTIQQEEQISRSGVTYLVRLDFAVAAVDYRGLYLNDGN